VDLCLLVLKRASAQKLSTRLVIVQVHQGKQQRQLALLAESVLDTHRIQSTQHVLHKQPWLGPIDNEHSEHPQLLNLAELMPEVLAQLFVPDRESDSAIA
jgi:hypothetical protein